MGTFERIGTRLAKTNLAAFEREWAELLFAAILPGEDVGLPAFASIDRTTFWRTLEHAPGPSFGPGLRVMIHALTFLPVANPSYRKPFFALSTEARKAFVAELANDDRYAVHQLVTTMKMMASFAYFDDPRVRARFDLRPEAER